MSGADGGNAACRVPPMSQRKSSTTPKPGDHVAWNTPQGRTEGVVTRVLTGRARAGGHVAKASTDAPQLEVRSDASGKTAIHRPQALTKAAPKAGGGSARGRR